MKLEGNVAPDRAISSNLQREMAVYDTLPEALRHLLSEAAPENYTVILIGQALISGVPIQKAYDLMAAEIRDVYAKADVLIASGRPPPRREPSVMGITMTESSDAPQPQDGRRNRRRPRGRVQRPGSSGRYGQPGVY